MVKRVPIPPRLLAALFSVTLRWVVLIGFFLALVLGGRLDWLNIAVLLGLIIWNLILTILAGLGRSFPYHSWFISIVDLGFSSLLFVLNGGFSSSVGWAGLLPVQTTGVYFGLQRGLLMGLLVGLFQVVLGLLLNTWQQVLIVGGVYSVIFVLVGGIVGALFQVISSSFREPVPRERILPQKPEPVESQRVQEIYNLTSALSATLNYQHVLEIALDISNSALVQSDSPSDLLVSAVMMCDKDGYLSVATARRLTPTDRRVHLPGGEGLLQRVLEGGEALSMQEPAQDPELSRIVAIRACRSVVCFPLRTGLDVYGVMVFAHPDVDFFIDERREVLSVICDHATVALQNARLYQDLEREKERIIETQEEARKKLARDLHDGPTQSVAAIAMRVNFARRLVERNPQGAAEELYKIEDLARRTTKEIRHMLFTLRPLVLESQGLIAALESMAEKVRETYDQQVIVEVNPSIVDQLDMSKQAVVFYIAEEAVNNARKHAQAEHIWVRLNPVDYDMAQLEIQDDGVGFDVRSVDDSYENRGSLGMVNMRERTELVNGVLQVESSKGQGTRIRVWIPLTEEAAERIRHRG
ncbi:MAG: GAF domain-containing sensor histidine kinase [Chloroflexota bacterium]